MPNESVSDALIEGYICFVLKQIPKYLFYILYIFNTFIYFTFREWGKEGE